MRYRRYRGKWNGTPTDSGSGVRFENDCAYFNTRTQKCEKYGRICTKWVAENCKTNTAPHFKTKIIIRKNYIK